MFIKRYLQLPKSKSFFLLGPRQTGKSTIIAASFSKEKHLIYDLLHGETYRKLRVNPELLREEVEAAQRIQGITHVVIDEVQRVPALLDEVHSILESPKPCYFVLSGSSARKLKRSHANMLGGRALNIHFHPFIYLEVADSFSLTSVLTYGSLPSVYTCTSDQDKSDALRAYVDLYLNEEIELEANIRNLEAFLSFLLMASAQCGEIVNYTTIAREAGVSANTIKGYYKILEDTLLGYFLMPYSRSIRKKLVQHPKFYLFDTGVVRAITKKLKAPLVPRTSDYGNAFEQWLITEMMRINDYKTMDLTFSFYRTDQGVEVDLVIETPYGDVVAVEIKSTTIPIAKSTKSLRLFQKVVPNCLPCVVCCCSNAIVIEGVLCVPWQLWLKKFAAEDYVDMLKS
jgi:uncharacterized protein